MPRTVRERLDDLRHAGPLDGAVVGEAKGGENLLVRVGLWLDGGGRVKRARYRATTCASLIAYAEAACELVEAGEPPLALGPDRVRAAVAGAHPVHHDRADLVALALARALAATPIADAGAPT
jgi:hypothetical protein